MTKTTAQHVRTGHVITNDYAATTGRAIEVAYVVRDTFTNPEGQRMQRIRFAGWERRVEQPTGYCGRWIEAGFGARADDRVYVLADIRSEIGYTYGAL